MSPLTDVDFCRPSGWLLPVKIGDDVKVGPSGPRKRDGYVGRVDRLRVNQDGHLAEVHVVGKHGFRVVVPARISPAPEGEKLARAKPRKGRRTT